MYLLVFDDAVIVHDDVTMMDSTCYCKEMSEKSARVIGARIAKKREYKEVVNSLWIKEWGENYERL